MKTAEDEEFERIEREAKMRLPHCGRCGEKLGDVHTCTPRGIEVSVVYHEGMKMFAVPVQPAPPPWWSAVENILKEYGLQAIDFVADFKQALAQQEHHDPIGDAQDKLIAEQVAQEAAQPAQQEPVAYLCENAVGHKYFRWKKPSGMYKPIALYTTPQPAQQA